MNEAPTLFDYAATRGASRTDGSDTSRAAARSIDGFILRDQQALVLGAVVAADWPGRKDGSTAYEAWCELQSGPRVKENVIGKRLGELVDGGFLEAPKDVKRRGSSCRDQQVYVLTEKGRAWHRMRSGT